MRRMTDNADTIMNTELVAITARAMNEDMILNALLIDRRRTHTNWTSNTVELISPNCGRQFILEAYEAQHPISLNRYHRYGFSTFMQSSDFSGMIFNAYAQRVHHGVTAACSTVVSN